MRDVVRSPATDRRAIVGAAWVVTVAAWVYLATGHPGGHGIVAPSGPGVHAASLALAFIAWTVMMVAMMLPVVTPWIAVLTTGPRQGVLGSAPLFLLGYFLVWVTFAAVAAGAQVEMMRVGLVPHGTRFGTLAGGTVLLAAGAFQFTRLKAACLRHCRSPLMFFMRSWRDGPTGALSLGLEHGLFCLGCCWALMAVAFAVGVMNVVWMAAITLLVCVENVARHGPRIGRIAGGLLVGWGTWLIATGLS